MYEKDLEKKLGELESKIESKEKELNALWCSLICVTIIGLLALFTSF